MLPSAKASWETRRKSVCNFYEQGILSLSTFLQGAVWGHVHVTLTPREERKVDENLTKTYVHTPLITVVYREMCV